MGGVLGYLTLIALLIVVLVLVVYLLMIIAALRSAHRNLMQLAEGLDQIVKDTEPLPEKLNTINGALDTLLNGLLSVNGHFAAIVKVLGR